MPPRLLMPSGDNLGGGGGGAGRLWGGGSGRQLARETGGVGVGEQAKWVEGLGAVTI